MRVLAISSQVAYGPVGLTASVPALQAKGHEVLAVPTISLSNHPGHGKPAGFQTTAADLGAMLAALEKLGVLKDSAAVMTGYFASADQVREVARVVARMKGRCFILIDPVIGDGAALYVPQAVAEAIRDELLPLATCATPNRFELAWLTGMAVTNAGEAIKAARSLGLSEVLATSVPKDAAHLATLLISAAAVEEFISPLRPAVPHGTGDFLAGLYLAERVAHSPEQSFHAAMTRLEHVIARSEGSTVLDILG